MSAIAVLAIRLENTLQNRVKVNVDLQEKISLVREAASRTAEKPVEDLDLLYAGVVLDDQKTLASYSFKSGRTIHVLRRKKLEPLPVPQPMSDSDIQQFLSALEEYGHKNIIQKFPKKDVIKDILLAVPDIFYTPGAIHLINDPELLVLLSEPDALQRALEHYPLLAEILPRITKYLKENPIIPSTNQASTSSGTSYSLESLESDDEDMEGNTQTSQNRPPEGAALSRNSSYMAITSAQLSAALASARNFTSTGAIIPDDAPQSSSSGSGSTGVAQPTMPIITNEMFGSALQQAFGGVTTNANSNGGNGDHASNNGALVGYREEETLESLRTRFQPQLQQMRDMGLVDETQNIRALQVTSGDVHAAIELVFGSDIDMNF